jgi:hypothetical protein
MAESKFELDSAKNRALEALSAALGASANNIRGPRE